MIQCANVSDANLAAQQVVEMDVKLGRSVDGNVDIFVADYILRNDGSANRLATIAAVDVDSYWARGFSVGLVRKIAGDEVADDHVSVHVVWRKV